MKVRIQVLFEILLMFKNCLPRSYDLYAGNGQLYSGFDTEEGLVPKGRMAPEPRFGSTGSFVNYGDPLFFNLKWF